MSLSCEKTISSPQKILWEDLLYAWGDHLNGWWTKNTTINPEIATSLVSYYKRLQLVRDNGGN